MRANSRSRSRCLIRRPTDSSDADDSHSNDPMSSVVPRRSPTTTRCRLLPNMEGWFSQADLRHLRTSHSSESSSSCGTAEKPELFPAAAPVWPTCRRAPCTEVHRSTFLQKALQTSAVPVWSSRPIPPWCREPTTRTSRREALVQPTASSRP